jgi:hypothetical protein
MLTDMRELTTSLRISLKRPASTGVKTPQNAIIKKALIALIVIVRITIDHKLIAYCIRIIVVWQSDKSSVFK